jgi:hypothetical protein
MTFSLKISWPLAFTGQCVQRQGVSRRSHDLSVTATTWEGVLHEH